MSPPGVLERALRNGSARGYARCQRRFEGAGPACTISVRRLSPADMVKAAAKRSTVRRRPRPGGGLAARADPRSRSRRITWRGGSMKGLMTTTVAALALAGTALAGDVTVDYDKAANFGAIKTFAVKLETPWGNPIGEKKLTEEMTQSLVEKGWKVAPEAEADAHVLLHGATKTKHSLNTFYSGMGGYGWRGWGGGGMGTATTTASEYTEG